MQSYVITGALPYRFTDEKGNQIEGTRLFLSDPVPDGYGYEQKKILSVSLDVLPDDIPLIGHTAILDTYERSYQGKTREVVRSCKLVD